MNGKKGKPSKELINKLSKVPCATIWSTLNRVIKQESWSPNTFYMRHVKPLLPTFKCVGPALTASLIDPNSEKAIYYRQLRKERGSVAQRLWLAISPGDIIVYSALGRDDVPVCGDVFATAFKSRGATGLITDSTVRDTPFLRSMDFPVFTKGPGTAISRARSLIDGDINIPIVCDGVKVRPGDIVVGDSDGVMVIPFEVAEEVAERGLAMEERDQLTRKLVLEGKSLAEAFRLAR